MIIISNKIKYVISYSSFILPLQVFIKSILRPYRYDTNPDNAQQVAPSNESRTQVAVNNEGKTNEATKNLKEPLQKGQTTPKDARQQQQQDKPQKKTGKGMKV